MSDTPQKDPALELFVVLWRASNWVSAYAERDARCHGLNPTEFAILEALYHKGALPLQQIGEKVLISSGNITYSVDKLEQKQLLVRRPSPHDRRVIFAELTPQGHDLLAAIFQTYRGHPPGREWSDSRRAGSGCSPAQKTGSRSPKRL